MPCVNCRDFNDNSCTDIITTNCVKTMFTPVEELDICLGESLTYVGNIILAKIKDLIKGRGIILEDLTLDDCEYIEDLLGADEKNLLNVLDIYKQAICELKDNLDTTNAGIIEFTNTALYTLGCLPPEDPCGDPYTFKELIQAIITKLCALNTQLEGFAENLLDAIEEGVGNFLPTHVKSCGGNGIVYTGTGETAVVTFQALVPPNCPILYLGSLGVFDASGIGLPNSAFCGWYLCNGLNGTPNSTALPQNMANSLRYIIRFT